MLQEMWLSLCHGEGNSVWTHPIERDWGGLAWGNASVFMWEGDLIAVALYVAMEKEEGGGKIGGTKKGARGNGMNVPLSVCVNVWVH